MLRNNNGITRFIIKCFIPKFHKFKVIPNTNIIILNIIMIWDNKNDNINKDYNSNNCNNNNSNNYNDNDSYSYINYYNDNKRK